MNNDVCVFCNEEAEIYPRSYQYNGREYRCKNCGNYVLKFEVEKYILGGNFERKHYIAGYLWETKHLREYDDSSQEENLLKCYIDKKRFNSILSDQLIPNTTMQRLDKLLIYLYKNTRFFGQEFLVKEVPLPVAYASNSTELINMFNELANLGYGEYKKLPMDDSNGRGDGITFRDYIYIDNEKFIINSKGHSRAEELISTNIYSNKVFVAMGFKRDLLDAMQNAIKPACSDCGFDAYIISDKEHNNGITDEIIVAIKTSKFIITDFTYNNCGAYFEAGYAQGYGLEVIRCCKKEWFDGVDDNDNKNKLHFDIQHYNVILWESEEDLKRKLRNRIRATIHNAKMEDGNVTQSINNSL